MNNDVCFIINSKNLYIDEYLVEMNIPIFFICKDNDNNKYAVLCEDTSELEYLICRVSIDSLYKMLKNELTLYDFIHESDEKWILKSGDSLETDLVEEVRELEPAYYPKKNEFLALNNEKICDYIHRIQSECSEAFSENNSIELQKMILTTLTRFKTTVSKSNKEYNFFRNSVKQKYNLKLSLVGGVYL